MKELKLSGDTFFVCAIPAGPAFDLEPMVAPVVAEVAQLFAEVSKLKGGDGEATVSLGDLMKLDVERLITILTRVCSQLPPSTMHTIREGLLGSSTVNNLPLFGPQGVFDTKMRGRSLDTWRLLWAAIQVNYPDFFALLAGSETAQQAANPSAA